MVHLQLKETRVLWELGIFDKGTKVKKEETMGGSCIPYTPREITWWYWLGLLGIFGIPLFITGLIYRTLKASLGLKKAVIYASLILCGSTVIALKLFVGTLKYLGGFGWWYMYLVFSIIWVTAFLYRGVNRRLLKKVAYFLVGYILFALPLMFMQGNFSFAYSRITIVFSLNTFFSLYLPIAFFSVCYIYYDLRPRRTSAIITLAAFVAVVGLLAVLSGHRYKYSNVGNRYSLEVHPYYHYNYHYHSGSIGMKEYIEWRK